MVLLGGILLVWGTVVEATDTPPSCEVLGPVTTEGAVAGGLPEAHGSGQRAQEMSCLHKVDFTLR